MIPQKLFFILFYSKAINASLKGLQLRLKFSIRSDIDINEINENKLEPATMKILFE